MPPVLNPSFLAESRRRVASGDARARPALVALDALDALVARADAALAAQARSVMDKTLPPPSGDKHDYMSFGPYWWPDPGTRDGRPYVRRDGEVNPESTGAATDRPAMEAMAAAVGALTLAHFFVRAPAYAAHAARLVRAWFLEPATRMNPHLTFGQAIPGKTTGRGIGIIDTKCLIRVADLLELPDAGHGYPEADRAGLVGWFGSYLDWLLDSAHGRDERSQENNHGTWYDVQVARFALLCGRDDVARATLERAAGGRIAAQVAPGGAQPRELARTRSFSYSVLNLDALCSLALLGSRVGLDLWTFASADGRGIRAAVEYMAPYADPSKTWPHPQIVPADRTTLVPALREAAVAYGEPAFVDALRHLDAGAVAAHEHGLVVPDDALPAAHAGALRTCS